METYTAGILMGLLIGVVGTLIVVGLTVLYRTDRLRHRGRIVPSVRKSLGYQEIRLCTDPSCSCHRIAARSRTTGELRQDPRSSVRGLNLSVSGRGSVRDSSFDPSQGADHE